MDSDHLIFAGALLIGLAIAAWQVIGISKANDANGVWDDDED